MINRSREEDIGPRTPVGKPEDDAASSPDADAPHPPDAPPQVEQPELPPSLSQGQLVWRRFRKHKLANFSALVLILFYLSALFADFMSPYGPRQRFPDFQYAPPQRIRFFSGPEGWRFVPHVYEYDFREDPETWRKIYEPNMERPVRVRFFVRGEPYRFLGLFDTQLHLFGTESGYPIFLLGTDSLGRDMFTRILYGSRISLTVGLVGVTLSLVLGLLIGGISGLAGGWVDTVIQRIIETLLSIPTIPLWMALSAALPPTWPQLAVYFGITVILSIVGWTGVARVVRGKFLALREEDFVAASRTFGAGEGWIIRKHLIPAFMSYVIVHITISIPGMILGETALSFLNLGLRAPAISWGVLLQQAQNIRSVSLHPWLLIPGLFVIVVVLAFSFLGDGVRDAVDPYSK
jgi:peptide/nickel transport system permease protein